VISYKSSIVTISLSWTVCDILALISQNFKKSPDPKCTPILQNFNIASTLYIQYAKQFEMSSFIRSKDIALAAKCRHGSRNPTTLTWGTVNHEKANTSRSQLVSEI